ncbi:TadE/TadG family type IV pilus assembly protein [Oceaniglobus ichthyenteri]|uniref:TadE/TadG family type IV pilus assembly protein n=1 Tax=Oceaniglobus ichthyenteri TaxID=2136177 RepID=UPI0013DDE3E4|nr:TadE/TadG family type IV pilus assembly protein [Oceaniglobus ichthyenteri]
MTHKKDPARPGNRRLNIAGFARDEDGSMILFSLYLFMAILLIGGISVDIMRNEFSRLGLQNTVDTAVLAAADLDQRLDPTAVVEDYFDKAGLRDHLNSTTVVENINSRTVTADSSVDVSTLFMHTLGISSMPARAFGTAHEEISDIEISMVLDISGSMGSDGRLPRMKNAARSFVNTVLSDERTAGAAGEVSLSIVPYSTQVNVGSGIAEQLTLDYTHDYSHCVDLQDGDYDHTELPQEVRNQTGHFDPWTRTSPISKPVCRNDAPFIVQPVTENRNALLAQIDALDPDGNTSTEIGAKWGAALLDPSFRPVTQGLVDAGKVDPTFDNRPFDYNHPNSMKVLVLMTDGANTTQYELRDEFSGGLSDVWGYQDSRGRWRFSVDHPENGWEDGDWTANERWYLPASDSWNNTRDGGDANTKQLTYPELWASASTQYNAYYMWYRQNNNSQVYYDWYYAPYRTISARTKDNRLVEICNAAKANGILIFTVAFEITDEDARLMKQCASSPNHYFDVEGDEIIYAFSAIASTINQLRLIQ